MTPPPPASDAKTRAILQENRAERYRLTSVARAIFLDAGRRQGLKHPHNFHRTAKCKYVAHGNISVRLDTKHSSAFYTGLVTCGNVWTCPICAAKVQERRRQEIAQAIQWAYTQDLQPVMVTLTFPHGRYQKIGQLLEMQAKALQLMRQGQPWQRLKERFGYQALIRALEVTHGEHGWHPHTHELWFVSSKADAEEMRKEILKRWESACSRAGLLSGDKVEYFRVYAVNVRGWCSAGDYLAKQDQAKNWGADREMAKASTKIGKTTGKHPFTLLADGSNGDFRARRLFLAFALGIKGKQQLLWTAGLKERVGVEAKSDEELAEEQREVADLLALLTHSEWDRIRLHRKRAEILDAAEAGGWTAMRAVLDALPRGQPRVTAENSP